MTDVFASGTFLGADGQVSKTIRTTRNGYHGNFPIAVSAITRSADFVTTWNANTRNSDKQISMDSDGIVETTKGEDFCVANVDGKFNGLVYCMVKRANGKIIIGGNFENYAGITGLNCVAQFNADYTLDTAFNLNLMPVTNMTAVCLAVDETDGSLYVGFDEPGQYEPLMKYDVNGTFDTAFYNTATGSFAFNSGIYALAVTAGKLIVGGGFTNYKTANMNYLVALSTSTGAVSTTFSNNASLLSSQPLFNSLVFCITVRYDGTIFVGGSFTNYKLNGQSYLILLAATGLITTLTIANLSKINSSVFAVTELWDNSVVIGGQFYNYGSTTGRNYLIKLATNLSLDTAFCVAAVDGAKFNNAVRAILGTPDDGILLGGEFMSYNGDATRGHLTKISRAGVLDSAFTTNACYNGKFSGDIFAATVGTSLQYLIGGSFTGYGDKSGRDSLIMLNPDGRLSLLSQLAVQTVTLSGGASQEDDVVAYYKDKLILQYRGATKAREIVDLFIREVYSGLLPIAIKNGFDIETAVGAQLDIIGKIVGASRNNFVDGINVSLIDADYRLLLRMRILRNNLGSSLYDVDTYLYTYFPDTFHVYDNLGMAISFLVNSADISSDLIRTMLAIDLLPRPMGVATGYVTYIPQLTNIFGFLSNTSDTTLQTGICGFNSNTDYINYSYFLSNVDALI